MNDHILAATASGKHHLLTANNTAANLHALQQQQQQQQPAIGKAVEELVTVITEQEIEQTLEAEDLEMTAHGGQYQHNINYSNNNNNSSTTSHLNANTNNTIVPNATSTPFSYKN
uniref:Uncharacterized protein n=1 Tax=Glossina brevipalpis TaxID=37001 RepID=A0A1A9X1M0_9MUSC